MISVARTFAIGLGIALLLVGASGLIAGRLSITCTDTTRYDAIFTGQVRTAVTFIGIAGATVDLFAVFPLGDVMLRTTTTNASGGYTLRNTITPGQDHKLIARASGYNTLSVLWVLPCPNGQPVRTFTSYFNLDAQPVLDAGFVANIRGRIADFTDASTGGPDRWTWNFGDGTTPITGTFPSTAYTYARDGTFTVIMTAFRTSDGASDTATATISVAEGSNSIVTTDTGNPPVITDPPPADGNVTGGNGGAGAPTEREVPFLLAILLGAIVLAVAVPVRRA